MRVYFDTGALVPLYVPEVFSDSVTELVQRRGEAIFVNMFLLLELETALRLKVFRREISVGSLDAVIERVAQDLSVGRLLILDVDWLRAFNRARRLGEHSSTRFGCRTLDLVHIAIAAESSCDSFVTADDRQAKAARAAGMRVLDIRTDARRGRR